MQPAALVTLPVDQKHRRTPCSFSFSADSEAAPLLLASACSLSDWPWKSLSPCSVLSLEGLLMDSRSVSSCCRASLFLQDHACCRHLLAASAGSKSSQEAHC